MNNTMTQTKRTSGLAIASLILSCLSIVLGPFGAIPGIICGHISRNECKKDQTLDGSGMALAGLIIGYIFSVLILLSLSFFLVAWIPIKKVIIPERPIDVQVEQIIPDEGKE